MLLLLHISVSSLLLPVDYYWLMGDPIDLELRWATYRDAADQCSLSRIWGGIHPPADDIPGRLIGEQVGKDSYQLAKQYFGN